MSEARDIKTGNSLWNPDLGLHTATEQQQTYVNIEQLVVPLELVCTLVHQITARELFINVLSTYQVVNFFGDNGWIYQKGVFNVCRCHRWHLYSHLRLQQSPAYENHAGWHSIVLQAVVDHKYP